MVDNFLGQENEAPTEEAFDIEEVQQAYEYLRGFINDFFKDDTDICWVEYWDKEKKGFNIEDVKKLSMIDSEKFRAWMRVKIMQKSGLIKESWIEPIINLIKAHAYRNRIQKMHLRTALIKDEIVIDLDEYYCLRLREGRLVSDCAIPIFKRFSHNVGYDFDAFADIDDINLIDKYTNFRDKIELELFKNTLPAYFVPNIAKPMQLSRGSPASGKSTLCRITKKIIDPCLTPPMGLKFPKDDKDWQTICLNNYVIYFDNLGYISKEQQDECCRVVTGFDIQVRKLYTNHDYLTYFTRNILLINAIELGGLNSDFLDRAIIWDLARLDDDKRKEDTQFWDDFERDLLKIRGAIFKILSIAIFIKDDIKDVPAFRLRDFAKYAMACAIVRGQSPADFKAQLELKTELQKDESISQSEIIEPLMQFLERQDEGKWEGILKDLLKALTEQEYGVVVGNAESEHTIIRNVPKSFPQRPESLSKEISKIGFLLARAGISFEKKRTHGKTKYFFSLNREIQESLRDVQN